ncbi:DUF3040 domain-containing protein [Streptomyces sp. NPDC056160]|uniref:DUF3040 domain-containing protein n=1 Tax=Streptomyces sp. NPDC056160 TaxID=3345731 RepID=UPI0035DF0674
MNVDRELARIEKHLVTQDPLLASKLKTFEQITAPRPRTAGRRHAFLLAAVVLALLALASALAAGTAAEHPRPPQVVREHPTGTGQERDGR